MENKQPYILWLPSWYPNKLNPFDGDFIQRHARAAALYTNIHVVHIVKDNKSIITKNVLQDEVLNGRLRECIIYYKGNTSPISKLINNWRWFRLYKKVINEHICKNGLPQVVHVHVPWKSGILALWIRRKKRVPFLVTEHWGIYNDFIKENYRSKDVGVKFFITLILKKSLLLVSASKYLALEMNKLVVHKKFKVIFNTVNTKLFFPKIKTTPVFRFIHVSNIVPLKNLNGIIAAAKLLYQKNISFELVIVGNKESNDHLKNLEDSSLKNFIFFKGELPYMEVAKEMQRANCLILFSDIENSPCVICEALCCGIPVISSRVGGVPELLNSSNSLLVPAKDINALAIAMEQLMDKYQDYNRQNIAEEAKQKFSYETIGKELEAIYKINIDL